MTPRRPLRTAAALTAATGAVALLAAAGIAAARPAPAAEPAPIRPVVTVLAMPADGAAAQVVPVDGDPVTPQLGMPVQLDARPASVSVFTRADGSGASCAIFLNGVVVAQQVTAAEGQPASCVWPG